MAGHQEGGEGVVVGCGAGWEGFSERVEVAGFVLGAEEGHDGEDATLVVEGCVAADEEIGEKEEREERFSVERSCWHLLSLGGAGGRS